MNLFSSFGHGSGSGSGSTTLNNRQLHDIGLADVRYRVVVFLYFIKRQSSGTDRSVSKLPYPLLYVSWFEPGISVTKLKITFPAFKDDTYFSFLIIMREINFIGIATKAE
jgi:hypothetical protein